MRRLIFLALGMTMLLMTGCVNNGPYYIYGDYIEELHEQALPGEDLQGEETPIEETPVETEL